MGLQDCGRAIGTHEIGEEKPPPAREWGLPGLLGTDFGPQLSLLLGDVLMPQDAPWGK